MDGVARADYRVRMSTAHRKPKESVALPESVVAFCNGHAFDATQGRAIEVLTTSAEGWPQIAHLSAGEVLVDASSAIRIALWANTRNNAALRATQRATLMFVLDGEIIEIRCRCDAVRELPSNLEAFLLVPLEVRDKSAPYAEVVSGIAYRYREPANVSAHWRALRDALETCF